MKPTEDPRQFEFEDNELDEAEERYEKVNKELDKLKC